MTTATVETYDPVSRLTKDLREAAKTLSEEEARFIVERLDSMADWGPK